MQVELGFIIGMLSLILLAYYITGRSQQQVRVNLVLYINEETDSIEALLRLVAFRFSWSPNYRLGEVQVFHVGSHQSPNYPIVKLLSRKYPYIMPGLGAVPCTVNMSSQEKWIVDCTRQYSTWEAWENISCRLAAAS